MISIIIDGIIHAVNIRRKEKTLKHTGRVLNKNGEPVDLLIEEKPGQYRRSSDNQLYSLMVNGSFSRI